MKCTIKISLVGLGGCGKTSLYSVAFAEKKPEEAAPAEEPEEVTEEEIDSEEE